MQKYSYKFSSGGGGKKEKLKTKKKKKTRGWPILFYFFYFYIVIRFFEARYTHLASRSTTFTLAQPYQPFWPKAITSWRTLTMGGSLRGVCIFFPKNLTE
jgi:hypothetical protein